MSFSREEALDELDREQAKLVKIRDYANGLRIWGSDATKQIATDILYLIGEK